MLVPSFNENPSINLHVSASVQGAGKQQHQEDTKAYQSRENSRVNHVVLSQFSVFQHMANPVSSIVTGLFVSKLQPSNEQTFFLLELHL